MDAKETAAVIEKIFQRIVGLPAPPLEKPRAEIAPWDSLRHAQLIIELQKQLALRFTTDEILRMETYGALLDIAATKLTRR